VGSHDLAVRQDQIHRPAPFVSLLPASEFGVWA